MLEKNKCYDALKLTNTVKDKLKGLTQVLTFARNSKNILMNHYPEVILAWLRTQDSLYDNETSIEILQPEDSREFVYPLSARYFLQSWLRVIKLLQKIIRP